MSEQLDRIKATRRGNRSVITKYIKEARDLLENNENIDENTSNANDRLNTLHDLLEEKLKLVKKFDEEILQLCDIKDIENEIEASEELNSRVIDVKKQIVKYFANKEIADTGNVPIQEIADAGNVPTQDISIPGPSTPQVEITEVGESSFINDVNNTTPEEVEQNNVNTTQDSPTPIAPNSVVPNFSSPNPGSLYPDSHSNGNYSSYGAKTKLPKLCLP